MSALRKKMSAHCMQGYKIYDVGTSSPSDLPMICPHFLILVMLNFLAMSMTRDQYSSARLLISSEAQRNYTFARSMPAAFQTSTKYLPTILILFKSPSILLLSSANQSATQKMKMPPDYVILLTLIAFMIPCAICIRPLGSKPS